jgi:hypothetical protein
MRLARASCARSSWVVAANCCASSATMLDPRATLALAERVAAAARQQGIATALIGATALAVHRYTRGTEGIDLATAVDPATQLSALERTLAETGLHTQLRLPDDNDPLGGVLAVWERVDERGAPVDTVEIVNFLNPGSARANPARNAIARAEEVPGTTLRCVILADLVALKLYAGGSSDLADIVQLIARNADVDLEAIRAIASAYDTRGRLDELIAEAEQLRGNQ